MSGIRAKKKWKEETVMEFNGFLFCGVLIMLGLNLFNP